MKKILYLSLLDWYFTKQRPQHFAELLSDDYKIFYICQASWNNKYLKKHKEKEKMKINLKISSTLRIIRAKFIPLNRLKSISKLNEYLYFLLIKIITYLWKPDIIYVTHPEHKKLISKKNKIKIIYDCMDNYSQFLSDDNEKIKVDKLEKEIINMSDLVITSSMGLKNKISLINREKEVITIKNASDFNFFNSHISGHKTLKRPTELKINKKIIGYFGGISSWFDIELVCLIAEKFKECEIVIIGPINNIKVKEKTKEIKNINWLGPKMYEELPTYLYYFDVCIMPFVVNELIKDVNPVKIYEYLSMGKPVVSPKYEEIAEFEDYIYLSNGHEEFLNNIEKALLENTSLNYNSRITFAKNNDWHSRTDIIKKTVEKRFL